MRRLVTVPVLLAVFTALAAGQDSSELLARMKAMEERIKALEAEVQALKSQQPASPAPAQPAPETAPPPLPALPQAGALPVYGGAGASAAKAFNPDISIIGDFIGAAGNGAGSPTPSLEMHESEAGFSAIIDPYARADVFISFGEHGVDLEDGYVTFPSLPGALQLRVGKMRAAFGKVNTLHNHVLPWTDRPLVTQNLVGGEEGIADAGLSLSRILPAPNQIFLEATAQIFRGDSEGVFRAERRSDVSAVGHLRAYRDITESTNLDLGGSFARGHSPDSPGTNRLFGLDATLRWKPLRRSIYRSFTGRGELIWAHAQAGGAQPLAKSLGYFVSADYQLGRRWFLGSRFDRSERLAGPGSRDTGGSLLLTYWPSEFSQVRGQLRRTRSGEGRTDYELLFQFLFSIGAHGAHAF